MTTDSDDDVPGDDLVEEDTSTDLNSEVPAGMLVFSNLAALLVSETQPDRYIPLIGFGEHHVMYQCGVRFTPGKTPIDRFGTINES